ncbi:MAG: hypothetical protein IJ651_01120 [Bacteroidales bacterium]|nr:hypothetical protein [Bacteroidales bacterium]
MKKTIIQIAGGAVLSLVLTVGLSSCKMSEDEQITTGEETVAASPVFHATIEDAYDTDTKVYVDGALHVLWNADDRVSIFAKTTRNKEHKFKGIDGATGGDFEDVSSGFGTGTDISSNYGVYPHNENTGYVFDDMIRTFFPQNQTYRAGSFGRGANLMVAKSDNTDLSFKNVGSYVCFKLYGSGYSVRSIILKGNSDETLSGPVKVSFGAGNVPSMVFDTSTPEQLKKTIVLKADSLVALGATEAEAVTFWMVVPPATLSGGFTITVIDSAGGIHEKKTTKSVTFERNKQITMKAFELQAEALAPAAQGIHPIEGPEYTFNKATDQVNIYEAEGKTWVRFLLVPTLTMYEIGPIPSGVAAGTTVTTTVSTYVDGVKTESQENCKLTVQSISAGIMNMVSDEGVRYVFRF